MQVIRSRVGAEFRESTDASSERRVQSRNPARLDDVVAEVALADAETFVDACRAAREAQHAWADVPAPESAAR